MKWLKNLYWFLRSGGSAAGLSSKSVPERDTCDETQDEYGDGCASPSIPVPPVIDHRNIVDEIAISLKQVYTEAGMNGYTTDGNDAGWQAVARAVIEGIRLSMKGKNG